MCRYKPLPTPNSNQASEKSAVRLDSATRGPPGMWRWQHHTATKLRRNVVQQILLRVRVRHACSCNAARCHPRTATIDQKKKTVRQILPEAMRAALTPPEPHCTETKSNFKRFVPETGSPARKGLICSFSAATNTEHNSNPTSGKHGSPDQILLRTFACRNAYIPPCCMRGALCSCTVAVKTPNTDQSKPRGSKPWFASTCR